VHDTPDGMPDDEAAADLPVEEMVPEPEPEEHDLFDELGIDLDLEMPPPPAGSDVYPPREPSPVEEEPAPAISVAPPRFELAGLASAALGGLSHADLVRWTAWLLARFGFHVRATHQGEDRECDLEVARDGTLVFVDCLTEPVAEAEGRRRCRRLLGSMVASRVRRGMVVTPGEFDPGCHGFVDRLADHTMTLVDGPALQATLRAMTSGPLRRWWDD
jgi:hypothetical protein